MKILMVNKFLYPRGGAESYALKVAECLKSRGHEVQFFGMYDEKNTVGNEIGEYTENMDFHSSSAKRFLYPFKIIYSVEAKKKIGKVLDAFKPDIVHMNNINFQLTPSIIDAVKKRGITLVQTVHDYQMTCPNHLLYDFSSKKVFERCVGRNKFSCIKQKCIHSSRIKSIIGVIEYYLYAARGTYKKVDRYICPSKFLEGKLIKNKPSVYEGKTYVIHNFIEKNEIKEYKRNFDFPYVVFAGRLSEEKGVKVLADAARLLPDVHFVVMGNGPDEEFLKGIDNVTMTGFMTGENLVSNIANASVIAVPSIWYENCPMAILEAQILGVPTVAVGMGGMAELVDDGVTGVLADAATGEDFAKALSRALESREKLAEMKKNCMEKSKESIELEEYCDKITELYKELLCRK